MRFLPDRSLNFEHSKQGTRTRVNRSCVLEKYLTVLLMTETAPLESVAFGMDTTGELETHTEDFDILLTES